jgi:5-methylcytosine-specific restriction enzyme B
VLETFIATHKEPVSFKKNQEKEIDQRAIRDIFLEAVSNSNDRSELFIGINEDRFSKQMDYSLEQCSNDSGFDVNTLKKWINAINRKGQIIFYGPPGTGKTYMAEKLAQHLISGGEGFMDIVQFHPAFAYEDFIQGIRPQTRDDGTLEYPLIPGRFLEFCLEARKRKDPCVIIIDEINRADLARVFGELLYLLEFSVNGRRDKEIPLSSGKYFGIPDNVRIIGTMNTADRSIALVDHALRRRFAFIHLGPNYEILNEYHRKKNTGFPISKLVVVLKQLNSRINDPHYELGISFFLCENLAEQIEAIWTQEVEPFLEEYYFDHLEYVDEFRWNAVRGKILNE